MILPFDAFTPVWLSRIILLEIILLLLICAAEKLLLINVINAGGALIGGASVEPFPKLLICPKLMTPPCINPSELIKLLISCV